VGTLVGNVWAGRSGAHYNQMTSTPLVLYNMQKVLYVRSNDNRELGWQRQ
jgi:hypothetical protein